MKPGHAMHDLEVISEILEWDLNIFDTRIYFLTYTISLNFQFIN